MRKPSLLRISVTASLESEEALTELLGELLGTTATSYHHFDSGRVTVLAYLEEPAGWTPEKRRLLREGCEHLRSCGLDVPKGPVSVRRVRREDWAESWKQHFPPLRIGSRLLLRPTWSRLRPRKGQQVVILDPGLSFGTGHHATTEYCLEQLVEARPRKNARSFLDLGCGSGILAISAAKLGFAPVRAVDSDPEAVRIARENAQVNEVSGLEIEEGDVTRLPLRPKVKYDVVCANLLGDLLIRECRRIAATALPEGRLILAGILDAEFKSVAEAYARLGWKLTASRRKKEWRSGTFTFQPPPGPERARHSGRAAPRP